MSIHGGAVASGRRAPGRDHGELRRLSAWIPSTDNVGVVEYGLYDSGLRVATVNGGERDRHHPRMRKDVSARDRRGRRRRQPLGPGRFLLPHVRVSVDQQAALHPTGLNVTSASPTGVTLGWSPSTDDVAVAGYGVYLSGVEGDGDDRDHGGTDRSEMRYDLRGRRRRVRRRRQALERRTAVHGDIALLYHAAAAEQHRLGDADDRERHDDHESVNSGAVYDKNGDKVEDDPGKIEFRVDGNPVLTEDLIPLGDSFADGSITVANGTHSFQVRALSDNGTLLASNTVTATVNNQTTPPPPPNTGTRLGDADDRERHDDHESGQLKGCLRQERRQGRGRPRQDRVPGRRQPRAHRRPDPLR